MDNPGYNAIKESREAELYFQNHGGERNIVTRQVTIDSTAVDSGNTPTTSLRRGLLIGIKTSDGNAYAYDPDGSDGTENPVGVLHEDISTLDDSGTAVDKIALVAIRANFKEANLINLDERAKSILIAQGCMFDEFPFVQAVAAPTRRETVTGNTTVVAGDHGLEFIIDGASGAVTFTLPTKAVGLKFWFFNTDDQNMVISGAGEDVVTFNNDTADGVSFSTSSEKIGAWAMAECFYHGANLKWRIMNLSAKNTLTIVDA